jgi:hypothetical protein
MCFTNMDRRLNMNRFWLNKFSQAPMIYYQICRASEGKTSGNIPFFQNLSAAFRNAFDLEISFWNSLLASEKISKMVFCYLEQLSKRYNLSKMKYPTPRSWPIQVGKKKPQHKSYWNVLLKNYAKDNTVVSYCNNKLMAQNVIQDYIHFSL